MSWAVGFDPAWGRDIGYGVPATCDQPACDTEIDRGLSYVCGGQPYGGQKGCGLYFCSAHLFVATHGSHADDPQMCDRCCDSEPPHEPKPDHHSWVRHKLTDPSWAEWRAEHPALVTAMQSEAHQ